MLDRRHWPRSRRAFKRASLIAGWTALASCAWADIPDWAPQPLSITVGDVQASLGGDANGAAFVRDQPAYPRLDTADLTGALRFFPSLERTYDSGLVLGFHGSILAYHDHLSNDRYDGEVMEKAYLSVQTGLGTAELGDSDGAGYRLAIVGPKVDEKTSIDDPEITFFRDPLSGRAMDEIFTVRTEAGATDNFAKVSYYSPRLFGLELGLSYAPSEGRAVLPLLSNGRSRPDRQSNIWQAAVNYDGSFGAMRAGAYGAISMARDGARTPGHEGLTDWALGAALDESVGDELKLSAGAAYRQTNAYGFDINDVMAGSSRAIHASAAVTYRTWIAGAEFTDGSADGSAGRPRLGVHGEEASLAYILNANLQFTLGWQRLAYSRSSGNFYSGPRFDGDAYFFHVDLHA
ncbi:MAG: porin [Alphaproteobacteria bacterium]|nr:porin [Alphaproteobacteria bacterium]